MRTFRLRLDKGWQPDWEEFERAVTPETRLLYLSNPNNPTGAVLSEEAMRRIAERCTETGTWLVADEVYLGAEIDRPSTKSFWGLSDRVIVTSGLSKAYGIPGVRIGWMIAPPEVAAACWAQHDYLTIGPNKMSDAIARVAVRASESGAVLRADARDSPAQPGNRARVGRELRWPADVARAAKPGRSAVPVQAPTSPASSWPSGSGRGRAP